MKDTKGTIYQALNEVRIEAVLNENIQKVISLFPNDQSWKQLVTNHKRDIDAARNGRGISSATEAALTNWAINNGKIKTDDVKEQEKFIDMVKTV
jgi:hypothetical protein